MMESLQAAEPKRSLLGRMVRTVRVRLRIPGAVWGVAMVLLGLLAGYLTDYWGTTTWAAPVAGLLMVLAKTIEYAQMQTLTLPSEETTDSPQGIPFEDGQEPTEAQRNYMIGYTQGYDSGLEIGCLAGFDYARRPNFWWG